ncbi:phosphatidylinositol-glycan biosynthesis class S protein-domain-containing protein [Vararia minispora EC-137]|uniref:Phosphatidylinositol-glycan biosynthesis class S protein-domain-containing protein n=1 Tax=Vararia minispora EC-137 TaxID=1314806 RepID=A0ACB8QUW8_9AGAM|nr:phosphatidylinositol-glycan biosynthesis class S protein-domain-containing protein [Vararia minispora EC-137]
MDQEQPPEIKHKHISSLYFQQPSVRRSILIASWIVILLGVPLWWFTTAIERLPLPSTARLAFWSTDKLEARAGGRDGYTVEVVHGLDHPVVKSRHLSVPVHEAVARLPDLLLPLVYPYAAGYRRGGLEHLVAQYAPRYKLAFTLLNEDAAAGKAITGWDIHRSIQRHISPVLHRVSALHNFTIESQVHFHSPLAFEPVLANFEDGPIYGLTQDDLKVFVNSAEWSLASQVSNDPVLHFIVFVPSPSHTPLRILDNNNNLTTANAFILPQWGGIVVTNQPSDAPASHSFSADDLDGVFATFRKQLLILLGVSELPLEYELADTLISDWQLDTLYRRRATENIASSRETLESIVKLVDQIPNMPVGEDVNGDFQVALAALEDVAFTLYSFAAYHACSDSPELTLQNSARAVTHASRAFFSPGMLALLYFPPEHTYAVYTPLFFPLMGPLVATALREFAAWRKEGKQRPTNAGDEQKVKID